MPFVKARIHDPEKGIGVEAWASAYLYDKDNILCLLSVTGPDSAVKAITAGVGTGRGIEILARPTLELHPSWLSRYRILGARLRCGVLHQVAAQEGFFTAGESHSRLVWVPPGSSPRELAFQAIDRMTGTPLLPGWKDWLYETLMREGSIEELRGTLHALKITVSEPALDAMVSEALEEGRLSFEEEKPCRA